VTAAATRPDWEAFRPHYERDIRPGLTAREGERARLHRWRWIVRVAGLAVGGALAGYWALAARDTVGFAIAGAVVAAGGLFGAQVIGRSLARAIKAEIVGAIAARFGLVWRPDGGLSPGEFRAQGVIGGYDRVRLDDGFEGVIDGRACALSEARLQRRERTRDSRTRYVTVFRGLLIRAETPGDAPTRVRLLRDGGAIGNAIGGWFREAFSDDQRIRMEDPDFEKRFEVYADDQVAARLLLTPTALEAITAFSDAAPSDRIQAAFAGRTLWLAIDSRRDGFETGGLSGRLDDPARARGVVEEIAVLWDVAALVGKLRFNSSETGRPPAA